MVLQEGTKWVCRKRLLRDVIDGELEVRTKRVVGEQILPPSRRQLFDGIVWMNADALQDIDEVGVGVDAVESASRSEAMEDSEAFGADLGSAKDPVLSPDGNGSDLAFQMVGVDL